MSRNAKELLQSRWPAVAYLPLNQHQHGLLQFTQVLGSAFLLVAPIASQRFTLAVLHLCSHLTFPIADAACSPGLL
jgi:hypothetical protein